MSQHISLLQRRIDLMQRYTDLMQRYIDLLQRRIDLMQRYIDLMQRYTDLMQRHNDLMQRRIVMRAGRNTRLLRWSTADFRTFTPFLRDSFRDACAALAAGEMLAPPTLSRRAIIRSVS